ncbi:MAG: alpha/beta fold hydrolase [Myxococcaceae bacterium]|nr:alpha/beta fold hydrolase [Myxococcaceae bacterium]MCA3014168.1 alpha/beta fold hydrolase [Myxococcaceae bacterium]
MGWPRRKGLLTATFAWELAGEAGLPDDERWAATLAALLRHLGCTAYANVEAAVAVDDIALRAALHRRDPGRTLEVVGAAAGAPKGPWARARAALTVAAQGARLKAELPAEACGAAKVLAERLRLGPTVTRALDEVFERYDGEGGPHGKAGPALSAAGSVATTSHVATVFALEGGPALARQALEARAGTMLEPRLSRRAHALVAALAPSPLDDVGRRHEALLAYASRHALPTTIDELAEAFGDFSDLQTPHAMGHSREVAALGSLTAAQLRLTVDERQTLSRAAHLHDLGQVAVPTSLWTTTRVHCPAERERAHAHVFVTERVLAAAPGLGGVAKVAGAHHEQLDGSGYRRGVGAGAPPPRVARVLAVADVLCALTQARPHRPARTSADAAREARAMAKAGRLEPAPAQCLQASDWRTAQAGRGVVVLAHGLRDHAVRYDALAAALAAKGLVVYGQDMRGHGRSGGERQRFDTMDELVAHLDLEVKEARRRNPGLPVFLFDHSLDGLLATTYALQHGEKLSGLVLSGAALKLLPGVSNGDKAGARFFGGVIPGLKVQALDDSAFVRDAAAKAELASDALVDHSNLPARSAAMTLDAIDFVQAHLPELKLPLLVMHGTVDTATNLEGSVELVARASSADKALKTWEGLHHDLLHEPERQQVIDLVTSWVAARLPAR